MRIFVTIHVASRSFQNEQHIDCIHAKLVVTFARLASRGLDHNGVQLNAIICIEIQHPEEAKI